MTSTLLQMFQWNAWANEKYRSVLQDITLYELKRDTPYGILLDRIIHIFASFKMWYQRMTGVSPDKVLSSSDFATWDELATTWKAYDQLLIDYVATLDDDALHETVEYVSLDKSTYRRKRKDILMHLTAHPNYHRGQISAIFKTSGLTSLPSTDMVVYFLETGESTQTLNE